MQPTYKFPHVPELADRAGVPFFDRAGVLTERKTQDIYRNSLFVPELADRAGVLTERKTQGSHKKFDSFQHYLPTEFRRLSSRSFWRPRQNPLKRLSILSIWHKTTHLKSTINQNEALFLKNSDIISACPERSHSWSSALAWKASIPRGIKGSNPFLSAL